MYIIVNILIFHELDIKTENTTHRRDVNFPLSVCLYTFSVFKKNTEHFL